MTQVHRPNYELRLRRILIVSFALWASIVDLTILRPTSFLIVCATLTTVCTAVTFRSWYIIHRNLKRDI